MTPLDNLVAAVAGGGLLSAAVGSCLMLCSGTAQAGRTLVVIGDAVAARVGR